MEKSKMKTAIQMKRAEKQKKRTIWRHAKNKIQTRISINDERGLIIVDIMKIN